MTDVTQENTQDQTQGAAGTVVTPPVKPLTKAEKAAAEKLANQTAAATSSTVLVGCRLPNGIVLENPLNPNDKIELAGINKARIIGAPYGITTVKRDWWELFEQVHADFAPIKSGAIFSAGSQSDLEIAANEVRNEKTGFEQMPQDALGIKKVEADK